ncbi:MAG TPA: hypothetical protein VM582_05835 [Candidatus Thermoplasmatota archaeon]|nr:hypothetical protein [Candidatus Thermoplasmatota archaeon]
MRPLAAILALSLLAGCFGAASDGPAVPAAAQDAPAAPSPGEAAPATPTPAPQDEPQAAAAPRTKTVEGEASATLAVGAPCIGGVRPCSRGPIVRGALEVPDAQATKATLTVHWNATTLLAQSARVGVHDDDGEMATAEGASPLTIEVPAGGLSKGEWLGVYFEPAAGGVFANERARLVLVLEY